MKNASVSIFYFVSCPDAVRRARFGAQMGEDAIYYIDVPCALIGIKDYFQLQTSFAETTLNNEEN